MTTDTIVYDKNSTVTGIALLENGNPEELEIITGSQAISGNVYLGKISKKVMLAGDKEGFFVNLGNGLEGFLNAEENGLSEVKLTEGQSIVVQVSQEKRAEKHARLVRSVQLVGSYLVYCPYRLRGEASAKIEDKHKMAEYMEKVKENMTGQEGWILRTASVEADFAEVEKGMNELRDTFEQIRMKARSEQAPCLLYAKPDSLFEYLARHAGTLNKLVTNSRNIESEVKAVYGDAFAVEICQNPFEEYGIDETIAQALEKEVGLKGGGRISIEETRACTAVDVDSGRDVGGGALNRINEEAAYEIARQIRLRNLAGKIVIDFAGHSEYKYIKPLLEILERELAKDSIKSHVAGLSRAGLVEIIRVRRRPSLSELMTEECPTCNGTGRVEKGA